MSKLSGLVWLACEAVTFPAIAALSVVTKDHSKAHAVLSDMSDRLDELKKDEASVERNATSDKPVSEETVNR